MPEGRRSFLKKAVAPMFVPASAFGANDKITFGMIGTGGRGRSLHRIFQEKGAVSVAVCDVYKPHVDLAVKDAPSGVKTFVDAQELIAKSSVDAIVIATPDHQHFPHLQMALNAGKDVYLEKPLSLSLKQSAEMIAAVRKTKQVVQIGMHRRSMPSLYRAFDLIKKGTLGNIAMVKAEWNWNFDIPLNNEPLEGELDWARFQGSAPKRPLEPKRFRWWRGFWDYSGGNMTDQGTHLMDVVQWLTESGPPVAAAGNGIIARAKAGEVHDVFSVAFEYPKMMATWTLNYTNSYNHSWSLLFQGDEASLVLDRMGLRMYKDVAASKTPWTDNPSTEPTMREPDQDTAEPHVKNFLECMKTRKDPNCTVETAAAAVAGSASGEYGAAAGQARDDALAAIPC